MDPSTIFLVVLAGGLFLILLRLAASKIERATRVVDTRSLSLDYSGDDEHHPALANAKRRFVGSPTRQARTPVPPGRRIILSRRQLERVNIQRRLRSRPAMNRAGFSNAIAHAWDQPRRQPDTTSDWLTYLILYECLLSGHQSDRVAVDTAIAISPDQPYNGHGGEFAGAGASGDWTSAPTAMAAAAAAIALSPDSDWNAARPLTEREGSLYYIGNGDSGVSSGGGDSGGGSSGNDSGSSSSDSGGSSSSDSGGSSSSDSGGSSGGGSD